MGFQPFECAVLEDSSVGIAAAKSAGMRPILYNPDNTYDSNEYAYSIAHMRELEHVIG